MTNESPILGVLLGDLSFQPIPPLLLLLNIRRINPMPPRNTPKFEPHGYDSEETSSNRFVVSYDVMERIRLPDIRCLPKSTPSVSRDTPVVDVTGLSPDPLILSPTPKYCGDDPNALNIPALADEANRGVDSDALQLRGTTVAQTDTSIATSSFDKPLFSTCDKSSIKEICRDVENLNASISDIVHQIIRDSGLTRYQIMSAASPAQLAINSPRNEDCPLVALVLQYRDYAEKPEMRLRLLDALLHDIVIGFVYDHVQGNLAKKVFGDEHTAINKLIQRIEKKQPYQAAQWWRSTAYTALSPPPHKVLNGLAKKLLGELNTRLPSVLSLRDRRQRYLIQRKGFDPLPHLQDIIHTAVRIVMKINGDILSERLELTRVPKFSLMCEDLFIISHSFEVKQDGPRRGGRGGRNRPRVLGAAGFGLVGFREGSQQKNYIRPNVTLGIFN
ncbi:hypothetical protein P691DRAFT_789407 [Macrolepiota fuliginosa MF-IS2]|uniref:Uncharacterized protein n=1 Tax=Macrolepiota fuliginosa MF-IS2 TaxID=1400762 RepID=A0A9P5X330_9AGAR|nr:hypothetical protein P691DRAFT_789407 [Macrolepiota fuliginosa MF-IS2]